MKCMQRMRPISYETQQVEPQFLTAYIFMSGVHHIAFIYRYTYSLQDTHSIALTPFSLFVFRDVRCLKEKKNVCCFSCVKKKKQKSGSSISISTNFCHTHTYTYIPWEDQCEWHRMTRMTGPDCAVMCNLITTHTHTHKTNEQGYLPYMVQVNAVIDVAYSKCLTCCGGPIHPR